ncbi:MAG: aminotransferase class IV [Caulobacteraceae bacterium]|nr:aminotransferase class IV [Caulobacteraceae bacterium]
MAGSQDFREDPRNERVLVYVDGALVPKSDAKVSIFDAGFSMGDGIWEGLRLHSGRLLFLEEHLDRLMAGAAQIRMAGLQREAVVEALQATLKANSMSDGAHLRLMVTRGLKTAVNQDPRNAVGRPTIVITAEYKTAPPRPPGWGLRLATVSVRSPDRSVFDMRLNSHSRLPLILALLEAIDVGADEALMLDPQGKVASCNATNFFWARGGRMFTSTGACCFNGITRGHVIGLCRDNDIPIEVGDFGPDHARAADEAFVTGTMGGLTPVTAIDGVGLESVPGPLMRRLLELYEALKDSDAAQDRVA